MASRTSFAKISVSLVNNPGDVAVDKAEATRWYRKAADQGLATAQFFMGNIFREGRGVAKDEAEAARWYQKAGDQGNAQAALMLGLQYYEGKGVKQDFAEAAMWFRKSSDQGNAQAARPVEMELEDGCLPARRPRAPPMRSLAEAAFVYEDDRSRPVQRATISARLPVM